MKKNLLVFAIFILLVSSVKYGSKAREANQPIIPEQIKSRLRAAEEPAPTFDQTISHMQEANREMVNGNPEPFKALWSRSEDITMFGDNLPTELVGWQAIEASLNATTKTSLKADAYHFERIASHEDEEQGYLVQKECYTFADGTSKDVQATILFRKEEGKWKIVHRHGDKLSQDSRLAHHSRR